MTPLTTKVNKHVLSNDIPDYENLRPYFGWVNVSTVQKPWNSPPNGESQSSTHSLRKDTSNLETQHLISLGVMKLLLLTLSFLTPLQLIVELNNLKYLLVGTL